MNEVVKYDNTINSIKFKNFTQRDFNFFFAICSKIRDKHTDQVVLTFQEIRDLANYKETEMARFRRAIESMYDKLDSIIYRYEDDEVIEKFHLFSKFRLLKTRDEVQIKVDEKFEFLLNDLDKNFTRYELETFVNLNSKHSKTLYRLLKQWRKQGKTQTYKVDDIKKLFESQTSENKDFLKQVIKPAVQELIEKELFKNLLVVSEKARKRGAPVIGYYFTFSKESTPESEQIEGQAEFVDKKSFNTVVGEMKKGSGEAIKTKKTAFNNFKGREYTSQDMKDIEKLLLNKERGE